MFVSVQIFLEKHRSLGFVDFRQPCDVCYCTRIHFFLTVRSVH